MADNNVTFQRRSLTDIVNRLDPKRLSEPVGVYPLNNGKIKTERPDLPGQVYRWAKDLPDVE